MKKLIILLLTVLTSISVWGQNKTSTRVITPIGFNYKALVSENGSPIANTTISVKVKLSDGSTGAELWYEEHTNVQTDANGIFSINIGEGSRISGSYNNFNSFDWDSHNHYDVKMDVEVDTGNGNGYQTLVSNETLKYVPYSKYAENSHYAQHASSLSPQSNGIWVMISDNNPMHGYILKNGTEDWFIYLNNYDFMIRNDGVDVIKIKNSDNSLEIKGKLLTPDTGDNDLKPIAYGTIRAGTGTSYIKGGTENFTIHKMNTGYFKITLNNYTDLNSSNTFVIASSARWNTTSPVICNAWALDSDNDFIYVKTFDSNNNPADRDFSFVIYKK